MRGYYHSHRVRCDAITRSIRHNNGLKDLLISLKDKIKVKWLAAVAKIVSGLVTAVVGSVASSWAKA